MVDDAKRLVVHCKRDAYDVYIGRGSFWGNPFSHMSKSAAEVKVDTREEAIACFEAWFLQQPEMVERAKRELKGKVLGCYCKPWHACHGDVLARIVNEEEDGT